MIYDITTKTMDSNHISDKRYLFAYGITDGALDDMTEEQRTSIIRAIECILKEHKPTDSEQKYTPKVSK